VVLVNGFWERPRRNVTGVVVSTGFPWHQALEGAAPFVSLADRSFLICFCLPPQWLQSRGQILVFSPSDLVSRGRTQTIFLPLLRPILVQLDPLLVTDPPFITNCTVPTLKFSFVSDAMPREKPYLRLALVTCLPSPPSPENFNTSPTCCCPLKSARDLAFFLDSRGFCDDRFFSLQ